MSTTLFDFIGPAIKAIDINTEFEIIDNDVNKITWLNGNPKNITSEQILAKAQELKEIADYKVDKNYQLDKPKGVRGRSSDNSLIKETIDWQPTYNLKQGLEKTSRFNRIRMAIQRC